MPREPHVMINLSSADDGPFQARSSSLSAMAPKPHGPHRAGGGLTRTHSRSSSTGGSRLGLNTLQLTQKDPAPARHPDKSKKAHHLHEANGRGASHLSRNNSGLRLQRDHANPPALRRPSASSSNRGVSSKPKAGFSLASPNEEVDDDEWISSESGAATPSNDSDRDECGTPVDKRKLQLHLSNIPNGVAKDDQPTPRAEVPSLPQVAAKKDSETIGPANGHPPIAPDYATELPEPSHQMYPPEDHLAPAHSTQTLSHQLDSSPLSIPQSLPAVSKARSETHSPPRRSPDIGLRSMTRPPSTQSIHSTSTHPLRPHPLIRAQSHGPGVFFSSAKPAPLAPLTTVPADSGHAEMTITSSPTSARGVSPTFSMHGSAPSPVLLHPSPTISEASRQLRRSSVSSRSSVMTLPSAPPMQPSASHAQLTKTSSHDRQRTISSSSTFAALSSLNLGRRAAPSPPKTPLQHLTVHFSPHDHSIHTDGIHPLLPPPYLNAHLTILAYRNPLAESYDRVTRAKNAR